MTITCLYDELSSNSRVTLEFGIYFFFLLYKLNFLKFWIPTRLQLDNGLVISLYNHLRVIAMGNLAYLAKVNGDTLVRTQLIIRAEKYHNVYVFFIFILLTSSKQPNLRIPNPQYFVYLLDQQ